MKRIFILISCLILLIRGLALEPCQTITLNASYSGNSSEPDVNGGLIYQSLDQLMSDLAPLVAANQTCNVYSVIVHPGSYYHNNDVSFEGKGSNYSLSFRKATMEKDPVIFQFHQANMTFNSFISLEFQDIQFSFDTDFGGLTISNGTECNIANVDIKDTKQTPKGYSRINVTGVTTTTISNFSVYFRHSSFFISVRAGQQTNVSLQLSNIRIEYALQNKPRNDPPKNYFIFAYKIQNLSAKNISISSIRDTTNNSLLQIFLYGPALLAESVTNVSISGVSISLHTTYYSHLFKFYQIQTLSLSKLNLTDNKFLNSKDPSIFEISNATNMTFNQISMSNTYMESLDQKFHLLFRINAYGAWSDITIDDLSISGNNELQNASVFSIIEIFRKIKFRNVSISGLNMTSGIILRA